MRIRTAYDSTFSQPCSPLARACFVLLVGLPALAAPLALAQSADNTNSAKQVEPNIRTLELGKPIERELAGGQSHAYQITLAAGQYMDVIVEQRGIDVVVALLGPDGKPIAEFDSEIRKHGQEMVSQVAEVAGSYRLNVQAKQEGTLAGRYEIRALEVRAAAEKDRVLQEARRLSAESSRLSDAGQSDEARRRAELALKIREKELGPLHPDLATSLSDLAMLYGVKGDYAKAEPLFQRALDIREKSLEPLHPNVAASLNNLAILYFDKGEYVKAEPLYQRALDIFEETLGLLHPIVATSLNNLANLYRAKGEYAKAEPLYQRALDTWEKSLGPLHLNVAAALNNLAVLYRTIWDYEKAEPLYLRALDIRERALGSLHPLVAGSLNNLAVLYFNKGDYTKAEPLYQRALDIREKTLPSLHPNVAQSLNNLAGLYHAKGDYEKAEPLLQRALEIREKALPPLHPDIAQSLNNLALLYHNKGDNEKAEPLLQRALEIREKALGPLHPDVAGSLINLANIYRAKGDYAKAEPLYQRALDIREKALPPLHPGIAQSLNDLAGLYRAKGDYEKVEPLLQRALEIREKALPPLHPDVAQSLNNLALLYMAKGEVVQAATWWLRASAADEHNIALNLAIGSERQKLAYLTNLSTQTNQTISFHANSAPNDQRARNLAATIILQRKGRVLDAMSDSLTALRQRFNTQDRNMLDQWKKTTAQLARIVHAGLQRMTPAEYQQQIKTLNERKEELEAEIGRRSLEFSVQIKPVTEEAVRSAIPSDAALVEFAVYRPFNAKYTKPDEQFGSPRYIAYVLRQKGEIQWVELGEAAAIDQSVDDLCQALKKVDKKAAPVISEKKIKRLAQALEEKVMRPVRKLLGETRQVLISPDGKLNLVPFAALVDENNRYLAERYSINYLTSGRDLLRLQVARKSKSSPLAVADPIYGEKPKVKATTEQSAKSDDPLAKIEFGRLLTEPEADEIKRLMPDTNVLTGEKATEAAVKQAQSPRILHIATHGFFLQSLSSGAGGTRSFSLLGLPETRSVAGSDVMVGQIENPLLRAGLALAGANRRQSAEDDGILTALEVAGLDLWGTKLVVLSACDTGIGEVKNGEGVYGMRRALVLAGAESQVVSLWKVNDLATTDLMIAYYRGLKQGEGRAEAMRKVQLQMLRNPKRRHPYYWASFIHSGEWANLDGKK